MKVFTSLEATGPVTGLAYANGTLGANVSLTTSDTWYDGPSVSLAAGVWDVSASAHYRRATTGAAHVSLRIGDGTTHYVSAGTYHASAALVTMQLACGTQITLASPATIKLQMACTAGDATAVMRAALANNGAGNNATQINAKRLA